MEDEIEQHMDDLRDELQTLIDNPEDNNDEYDAVIDRLGDLGKIADSLNN